MKFPYYIQFDAKDCGPTCLRIIAKYYGKSYSLQTLRERSFITRTGVSFLGISDAAESIGFRTQGVKISFTQLVEDIPFPCIAHWKQEHFVVIYNIKKKRRSFFASSADEDTWIYVADPALGLIKYKEDEFKKAWLSTKKEEKEIGHCLLLEPTAEFFKEEGEEIRSNGTKYILSYLKPYRALIYQLMLGFIVSSIFSLIIPFLTQSIVDKGISYKDISLLTLILLSQVALTLGTAAVSLIRGWIMLHLTTRVNISLIADFLSRLMKLPLSFFDSKMTGDLMQRIGDNNRIQEFLTSSAINILFSLANFIIFSFIIASYNLTIFLIFLGGSILYVLWIRSFLNYRRELDNRRFAQMSDNQSNIIQMITGMQEIQLNNCEKQRRWEWESIQSKLFKISAKGMMIGQYQTAGGVIINSIKNFTITYLSAKAVIDGQMTLGMMLSVQYIIGQMNGPIDSLIGFVQSWQDAKISIERLNEIRSVNIDDNDPASKLSELPEKKDISLKNVTFRYGGPETASVLDNVNLTIPAGRVTAVVGVSGSGKTTLLKLLLGFYSPLAGEILVGGVPLPSINKHVWRQHTGTVMQEGFIFSDTIANNIAISDETVDKKKLGRAADVANIDNFIRSLPLNYNTKIGGTGTGISQGQKQRILIARAVYKNPDFIFFDEATNALDTKNERIIMNNLEQFFNGKTVIIVAHRLSTVKNADNIVVFEKGKIIEQGPHEQLVNNHGAYYELVRNQLEL